MITHDADDNDDNDQQLYLTRVRDSYLAFNTTSALPYSYRQVCEFF